MKRRNLISFWDDDEGEPDDAGFPGELHSMYKPDVPTTQMFVPPDERDLTIDIEDVEPDYDDWILMFNSIAMFALRVPDKFKDRPQPSVTFENIGRFMHYGAAMAMFVDETEEEPPFTMLLLHKTHREYDKEDAHADAIKAYQKAISVSSLPSGFKLFGIFVAKTQASTDAFRDFLEEIRE